MSKLHAILEDFGSVRPTRAELPAEAIPTATPEQTYEAGYASGWEDALAQAAEKRASIDAEFQRNIEDLKFSYVEATGQIRGELTDFIDGLLSAFLPSLVPELTVEHVRDLILKLGEPLIDRQVHLVTSTDVHDHIAQLVKDVGADFEVVLDETLARHQVFVRFEDREKLVDVQPLIEAVRDQFRAMHGSDAEEIQDVG